ncbi:MAG: hypothetical protein HZY79_12685 [Rhodoblastus sp.]|nr:MAG: hypothetical protein HZY79_12685 [Rhodoblastus sp.]
MPWGAGVVSKSVQFAVVGAAAFVVVGFVLPRVVAAKRGGVDIAIARNTRALGPGAPWRAEEDKGLAKRLHDAEPELTPIALWRCPRAACGFEGRYMVFAGPDHELPRPRLEALLDLAARPIRADHDWPPFPDTQAQGFRYPQRLFYVVSQTDRAAGAAAAVVAGDVIDQVAARVSQGGAPPPEPPADAKASKASLSQGASGVAAAGSPGAPRT